MFQILGQSGLIKPTHPALFVTSWPVSVWYKCASKSWWDGQWKKGQFHKDPAQGLSGGCSCPQALARLAAAVGTHSLPAFCLSEQGENIFPLPCLGNRKQILIKTLPHTDWAGKRWSLATLRFVLQMQTSNYCKVRDRMAGLTNVYSPWCCCFQMYLYFMQTYS